MMSKPVEEEIVGQEQQFLMNLYPEELFMKSQNQEELRRRQEALKSDPT